MSSLLYHPTVKSVTFLSSFLTVLVLYAMNLSCSGHWTIGGERGQHHELARDMQHRWTRFLAYVGKWWENHGLAVIIAHAYMSYFSWIDIMWYPCWSCMIHTPEPSANGHPSSIRHAAIGALEAVRSSWVHKACATSLSQHWLPETGWRVAKIDHPVFYFEEMAYALSCYTV